MESKLNDALAELEKWKNHTCGSDGNDGDLMKELLALRAEHKKLTTQLNNGSSGTSSGDNAININIQKKYDQQLVEYNNMKNDLSKLQNDLSSSLLKNSALEDLIKQLRERLASGGWTRARGEARNAKLEMKLAQANSELQRMIEKCGKNGVYLDQRNIELEKNKNLSQCYFTSWLVEALRAKDLEKRLGDGQQSWEDEMNRYVVCVCCAFVIFVEQVMLLLLLIYR